MKYEESNYKQIHNQSYSDIARNGTKENKTMLNHIAAEN